MPLYRKKPLVIEAVPFSGSSTDVAVIQNWMQTGKYQPSETHTRDLRSLYIETLEGVMEARPGDWIIKGTQGEFYPCRKEIFEHVYEEVQHAD